MTFDTPEKEIQKRNAFCGHWLCLGLCLCLCLSLWRCLLQLQLRLGLLLYWLRFWQCCVCGRGTRVPDTRPYANEAQSAVGGRWVEPHQGTTVATFGALCLAQWRNRKCDCAAWKQLGRLPTRQPSKVLQSETETDSESNSDSDSDSISICDLVWRPASSNGCNSFTDVASLCIKMSQTPLATG